MTILREKMIDLMTVRNFSVNTQKSYLYSVSCYAKYYDKSPDQLSQDDLQRYLIYLVKDKHLSANSCRVQLQAIRFLYLNVLKREACHVAILAPKRKLRIPELLTREEALRIVNAPENISHKMQLQICYACGLRRSEVLALRVKDIDGQRELLKVEQGKGAKDRFVPLSKTLLELLREYWRQLKPTDKLFYTYRFDRSPAAATLAKLYSRTKQQVSVNKKGGIHALRHAFATHQLEAGLPLHLLQRWLGHADIRTTMRYIHWVPSYHNGQSRFINLLSEGNDYELS